MKVNKFMKAVFATAAVVTGTTGVIPAYAGLPSPSAHFNSAVPGNNPFLFCSLPRPSRKDWRRPIYDRTCPEGKKSAATVMQQNGFTEYIDSAKELGSQIANIGVVIGAGAAVSAAGSNILGGNNQNNGISANNYNQQLLKQIQHEDYLRKQELRKKQENPDYVMKEIPDSRNFRPDNQAAFNKQQQSVKDFESKYGIKDIQLEANPSVGNNAPFVSSIPETFSHPIGTSTSKNQSNYTGFK